MKPLTLKSSLAQWVWIAAVCPAFFGATSALAGEGSFTPVLAVSEEFNDNILDTATDTKSDFVTRIQPGVATTYRAPSLKGDLNYHFDYQNYARGTKDDEKNHFLALSGSAELVDNFLFLEVSDTLKRVSLDVTRDVTGESPYANQSDQNRGTVSPYLLWRLGEKTFLKTGYRFTDTRYSGVEGIDRREHIGFAEYKHTLQRVILNAGYTFASVTTDETDYDQHDLSVGFNYEFADKSFLFASIGNSWQKFSDARSASNPFWHAGISREYANVKATLDTHVTYSIDPAAVSTEETVHRLSLEKALPHGLLTLITSYAEYRDTFAGTLDRRKADAAFTWRGEISPKLSGNIALTGDRVTRKSLDDYPYHLNFGAGVSYLFNYNLSCSVDYNYIDYRMELDSAAAAKQTNRLLLTLRKSF